MTSSMKKWYSPWAVLVFAVVVMSGMALFQSQSGELHHLKSECSRYRTFLKESPGFTGDFYRCVRARCSAEFFEMFRKEQGFVTQQNGEDAPRSSGWSVCNENWWNPPEDFKNTFVKTNGDQRTLLAFKDGYIYYDISAW